MAIVNGVKSDESAKKPPVRLQRNAPEKKTLLSQTKFDLVQRYEQRAAGLFIGSLGRGEVGLVNSIVDVFVNVIGKFPLFVTYGFREEIHSRITQALEGIIEHPTDIIF